MAKKIHLEKVEETEVDTKVEASVDVKEKVEEKIEWPEVSKTGRYVEYPFRDGYVVYNPDAIRITGIVTKIQAEDTVRQQNTAAHIKG